MGSSGSGSERGQAPGSASDVWKRVSGSTKAFCSASARSTSPSRATTRRVRRSPRASRNRSLAPGWIVPAQSAGNWSIGPATRGEAPIGAIHTVVGTSSLPRRSRRSFQLSTAGPDWSGPVRIFGPPRSMRMRHGRPVARSAARRWPAMRVQTSGPSWAQLIRRMLIPRSTSARTASASSASAASAVTMIRTARPGGAGPRRASAFRESARRASPKSGPRSCSSTAARPPSPRSARRTARSVASTCPSARPSDDSPSSASACWRRRRSCARNVR